MQKTPRAQNSKAPHLKSPPLLLPLPKRPVGKLKGERRTVPRLPSLCDLKLSGSPTFPTYTLAGSED